MFVMILPLAFILKRVIQNELIIVEIKGVFYFASI